MRDTRPVRTFENRFDQGCSVGHFIDTPLVHSQRGHACDDKRQAKRNASRRALTMAPLE
jgi:hypothetical protein